MVDYISSIGDGYLFVPPGVADSGDWYVHGLFAQAGAETDRARHSGHRVEVPLPGRRESGVERLEDVCGPRARPDSGARSSGSSGSSSANPRNRCMSHVRRSPASVGAASVHS
jgi:hypothetical protein